MAANEDLEMIPVLAMRERDPWEYICDCISFLATLSYCSVMKEIVYWLTWCLGICRFFLIPYTCLVLVLHHHNLIQKFVPLHENFCRGGHILMDTSSSGFGNELQV